MLGLARHIEVMKPEPGDILAFRVTDGDRELCAWLAAKQIRKGNWSEFIRQILNGVMVAEKDASLLLNIEASGDPGLSLAGSQGEIALAPLRAEVRRWFEGG